VAVEINGQGPFRFIVDTGANHSALSPSVAERLALPTVPGGVEVHGVTGTATLPAVHVASLRAGDLSLPPSVMPVLPGDIFGGADGLLGVAGIQKMRLDVDFLHDRVSIGPSNGRRARDGFLVVRASLWQGGLLLVDGRVGSVPTKVIIDTGAERTMGNLPLRAAVLGGREKDEELETTVLGATPEVGSGTYFRAPRISIGRAQLLDLAVTFGDLHVFELWGLTNEPALVLGMDVLGKLEQFVVDYRRQEFQVKGIGGRGSTLRRCTSSTCGSRIPEPGT
jgi:predicted aspartyl protease